MQYETMIRNRRKYILVPVKDFEALIQDADEGSPLPPADAHGNRPALAFMQADIAGSIIHDRKAVGLSQAELARRAGVRVETLNRAERGTVVPDTRTLAKIERALVGAGLNRGGRRNQNKQVKKYK